MLSINDIKLGVVLNFNGEPFRVVEYQHARTAQRRAFVRSKLKNLINGKVIEKTFNASDKIEEADIEKIKANYLYKDQNNAHFMDNETFEQFTLSVDNMQNELRFLKEGIDVSVLKFNQNPVSIEIPKKIKLKIASTEPAVKGDTAQASAMTKPAILETGATIQVPPFIKEGETIVINTEKGTYSERA